MDEHENYRLIFNIILGPTVTILGLVGNTFCILAIAYRKYGNAKHQLRGMRGYMYTYLISLAFADICFMTCAGMNYYLTTSKEIQENNENLRNFFVIPSINAFKATSDFIVIFMTVDRSRMMNDIAELRLQALRKNAEGNGKNWMVILQVTVAFVLSFALYAPYYFPNNRHTFAQEPAEEGSFNNTRIRLEDLKLTFEVICIALTKVFPVLVIVTLNILIIKRLRIIWTRKKRFVAMNVACTIETRRQNWSVTSKNSIREQKLAFLLVIIACSFVVLTLPANIAYIIFEAYIKEENDLYNDLIPLFAITNFLESVNYSINFYIYCVVHDEIRHSFVALCKSLWLTLTFRKRKQNSRPDSIPGKIEMSSISL